MSMTLNSEALEIYDDAVRICRENHDEFLLPEHLALAFLAQPHIGDAFEEYSRMLNVVLCFRISQRLDGLDKLPVSSPGGCDGPEDAPVWSDPMEEVMKRARELALSEGAPQIRGVHMLQCLLTLENCWTTDVMVDALRGDWEEFMRDLRSRYQNC